MTDIDSILQAFAQNYPSEMFTQNTVVMRSETKSDFFYFVETGAIKMSKTSKDGKHLILHTFFPGSFFSLLTLASNGLNPYDFTTQLPSTLRKIPQKEVVNFLTSHPEVLFNVQIRLLKGLSGLLQRVEQTVFVPAYNQVASLLVYFSRHFAESSHTTTHRLMVKITHQEIAEWLGLSRENVSIQMKRLERQGLIKVNNHVLEICDLEALNQLSQSSMG